jgi:hypothetical protein
VGAGSPTGQGAATRRSAARIKGWNAHLIHVVYRCGDHWDCFEDYTAYPTLPEDLDFLKDSDPEYESRSSLRSK